MGTVHTSKKKNSDKVDNRIAMVTISAVVFSMAFAVGIKVNSLHGKQEMYQERERVLIEQVAAEEERAAELEQERLYIQTNGYIEKTAKEKLGLVNPDEILLKPEQ
ncbi:MAG: septum formation initiator [Stomatobaculum sp.]|nr:septum formation initiator [Stomatobaculum sp.]